jgi:hypothetical protein
MLMMELLFMISFFFVNLIFRAIHLVTFPKVKKTIWEGANFIGLNLFRSSG